ncbi:hypothetical protein N568_0104885, partial [Lactococcus garvieae TRF1]
NMIPRAKKLLRIIPIEASVSRQTGVKIYSKIFTDSLADESQKGDTYYDMLKWNIDHITDGLSSK